MHIKCAHRTRCFNPILILGMGYGDLGGRRHSGWKEKVYTLFPQWHQLTRAPLVYSAAQVLPFSKSLIRGLLKEPLHIFSCYARPDHPPHLTAFEIATVTIYVYVNIYVFKSYCIKTYISVFNKMSYTFQRFGISSSNFPFTLKGFFSFCNFDKSFLFVLT